MLGVSERRACRVLGQPRSTQRHRVGIPGDGSLQGSARPPLLRRRSRTHAVVPICDGNDLIIYVDGVEEDRSAIGFVVPYATPDPLWIGNAEQTNRGGITFPVFDGLLDEVALWNRGLSGDEVQAIFDAGSAGMCQPVPPPTPEELLQRIEDLEAEVAEQADHTHTYRTGEGQGHNNTEAETGPAEPPLE